MAKEYKQTHDLPIRKAVWDLLKQADDIMCQMERGHKFNFGSDIVSTVRKMLRLVSRANNAYEPGERLAALLELCDEYHDVADLIKYCIEMGYLGDKEHGEQIYVATIPLLANVERQTNGWIRKTQAEYKNARVPGSYPAESIQKD